MVDYTQQFTLRGKPATALELLMELYLMYSRCWLRQSKDSAYNQYLFKHANAHMKNLTKHALYCCTYALPKQLSERIVQEAVQYMSRYVDFKFIISTYTYAANGDDISSEEKLMKHLEKQFRKVGPCKIFRCLINCGINEKIHDEAQARNHDLALVYEAWKGIMEKWARHLEDIFISTAQKKKIPNTFMKDYLRHKTLFCRERILGFSKFYKAAQET